jgi:hypothetical protein
MVIEFVGVGAKTETGVVDHIAIEVQGIEALAESLRPKGSISKLCRLDAGLFPNGFKNVFFTGPAGEKIELVDFSK